MHDALTVRLVESFRYLDRVGEGFIQRDRSLLKPLGQGLPLDVLHHQEDHISLPADVVERADMRMVQAGDGPRFPLETLAEIGIVGQM